MLEWLPLNNYQMREIRGYTKIALVIVSIVIILGNIITAIVRERVVVNQESYVIKEGFPLFISQYDYMHFIKDYPYEPGVKLIIHRMGRGESYWDITNRYNITIDTLIAANPYLSNLVAQEDTEVVVPGKDGVLMAFDNFFDVVRMSHRLNYTKQIKARYLPTIFKIYSTDDIRLAFFEEKKPVIINIALERLYRQKNIFQSPIYGYFTSLFGDRIDPIWSSTSFHNGVDIRATMNAKIKPARDGMVLFTGWRAGYGKTIVIQHYDGYSTLYGHCNSIKVEPGEWVTKDSIIGHVGSTGRSTGPHLHFTLMRHGEYLNPLFQIW